MPRVHDLPPPPERPERPPPVRIEGEAPLTLHTSDGLSLSALARVPPAPRRAVVLCHPHPLYGGTMHNAVIAALARALSLAGDGATVATLRFNFRGVEGSEGVYGRGALEVHDARAAVARLRGLVPAAPVTLVGYSFGTWVGLRAASLEGTVERVALVAPAVRIFDYLLAGDVAPFRGPLLVAVGDRDPYVDVEEARSVAARLGATLEIVEGAEHFFVAHRRRLAERLLPFLAPEAST